MFNPYEKWLGITAERPLNYYQLLGIDSDEADPQRIEKAARRQAAKLEKYEDGPYAEQCARIAKQIQQAKATLVNATKRKEYDAQRHKTTDGDAAEPTTEKAAPTGEQRGAAPKRKKSSDQRSREEEPSEEPKRAWLWPVVGGAAILVLASGATAFWLLNSKKAKVPAQGESVALATSPRPQPAPVPAIEKKKEEPPALPTVKTVPPPVQPAPQPPPSTPAPVAPVVPVSKPAEPKPAPPVVKLPVPDKAAQARAEKALRETYKADYAKTHPEDRLALAGILLQPGREDRRDPAAWFVLLREARDLAVQGNGPRLATAAVNELDHWFVIDALEMKVKALTALTQAGGNLAATAQAALALTNQAIDDDNYDAALRLVGVAETAARKLKANKKQLELIEARKTELEGFKKDLAAAAAARQKLRQNPEDPDANLVAGKHLAFFQGKWDEGLPLLAKGGDNDLKAMARKDLSQPAAVADQIVVANQWWSLANAYAGRDEMNLRRRAKTWYVRAAPGAAGPEKAVAVDRIKTVDDKETARIIRLLPGSFYGRGPEDRVLLLRESGGTWRSENAVDLGLKWLVQHQEPSGMWSNDAYQAGKACNCGDQGQKFDTAGTAFGLLPFLGAGNTHVRGPYARTVKKGLTYLLTNQKKDGNFSDQMYENALATIAVCELYGVTRDPRLQGPAQAAVNFILKAQNDEGGWGYSPGAKGDTSVTGWQFAALKAGVYASLAVPPQAFQRLSGYLDSVAEPSGLGYGYNAPGAGRSTSAVGLLCREFLGWGPGHPGLAKGVDYLFQPQNFPSKDKLSIYFIFYATQVMHHIGSKTWEEWNPKVRDLLIDIQDQGEDREHSHQKGSWSPKGDDYAMQGGRLMFTSLALLTLEVYYYHIPLYGFGQAVLLD